MRSNPRGQRRLRQHRTGLADRGEQAGKERRHSGRTKERGQHRLGRNNLIAQVLQAIGPDEIPGIGFRHEKCDLSEERVG